MNPPEMQDQRPYFEILHVRRAGIDLNRLVQSLRYSHNSIARIGIGTERSDDAHCSWIQETDDG